MQIIEVKNNLVKISYDTAQENLILSGFVAIKDAAQSFIGQIINLDANPKGNFAIIKLLFNFDDEGVITNYNGSIPNLNNPVETVPSQELLELLPIQNPILFGELAQQDIKLNLDRSIFENKLLICSEKEDDNELLINNIAAQLTPSGKKLLVIDLNGSLDFSKNRVVVGKDFKLPLNYDSINFIYNGLEDTTVETRALIQEVFLEVQNYVKTLAEQYIPFESFKSVVDSQYEEMDLVELLLLKNKLLKYDEEGIFAQERSEFDSLRESLKYEKPTIFDLSGIDEKIQREMISYAYSLMNELAEQSNKEFYVILNVDNSNSDKKLLKQIFTAKKVYSTLICLYSYKYLNELKQLSKNSIFFTPIQQQADFAIYNVFLNKLNPHEFVIYGQATRHIPFIVKLSRFFQPVDESLEETKDEVLISQEEILDEEIKRDVDEIYTAPRSEDFKESFQEEAFNAEIMQDELTEEDLDYIDDLAANDFQPEVNSEEELTEDSLQEAEEPEDGELFEEIEENTTETFSDVLNQQGELQQEHEFRQAPPAVDILPANISSVPIVPIYSADVEPQVQSDEIEQGDIITHPKYGRGTVEKLISYGSKTLCSINFDNVGRRLLDPNLAEIKVAFSL